MFSGVIAEDGVKVTVMSFGEKPIESSVIKFNDYGTNRTRLNELIGERLVTTEGKLACSILENIPGIIWQLRPILTVPN